MSRTQRCAAWVTTLALWASGAPAAAAPWTLTPEWEATRVSADGEGATTRPINEPIQDEWLGLIALDLLNGAVQIEKYAPLRARMEAARAWPQVRAVLDKIPGATIVGVETRTGDDASASPPRQEGSLSG